MFSKILNENWFVQPLSMEKPVLLGSRCRLCGETVFPKKEICASCFSRGDMEDLPLSRHGELHCYTIARAAPEGFVPPYAFGRVILPEGVRIFSILQDWEPAEEVLKIGMRMTLAIGVIRTDDEGEDVLSYVFKPNG